VHEEGQDPQIYSKEFQQSQFMHHRIVSVCLKTYLINSGVEFKIWKKEINKRLKFVLFKNSSSLNLEQFIIVLFLNIPSPLPSKSQQT